MALVGIELVTLVFKPDTLTTSLFYYRSVCIIVNDACRRRTSNICFRARRADHLFFIYFFIGVYASWMMALAGVEPETLVSEPDALTTRPPPCARCLAC